VKRHELDPISLIAGVIGAVIAIGALSGVGGWFDVGGTWLVPFVLIGIGVAGLLAALRPERSRSGDDDDDGSSADDETAAPTTGTDDANQSPR
jgi:hypothetical protein